MGRSGFAIGIMVDTAPTRRLRLLRNVANSLLIFSTFTAVLLVSSVVDGGSVPWRILWGALFMVSFIAAFCYHWLLLKLRRQVYDI